MKKLLFVLLLLSPIIRSQNIALLTIILCNYQIYITQWKRNNNHYRKRHSLFSRVVPDFFLRQHSIPCCTQAFFIIKHHEVGTVCSAGQSFTEWNNFNISQTTKYWSPWFKSYRAMGWNSVCTSNSEGRLKCEAMRSYWEMELRCCMLLWDRLSHVIYLEQEICGMDYLR